MQETNNFSLDQNVNLENDATTAKPQLGQAIGSAIAYFFSMLAFILFVCPFSFWEGATIRLFKQCKAKSLKNFVHQSRWPFLSYMKKIFFEFFIDGMMFISYFVGILMAFVVMFNDGGIAGFFVTLIVTYYSPLGFSLVRDIFTLLLLPFQKFLSWVSKPAQQIDVDFHNR